METIEALTKVTTYKKADCILFNSRLGKKDQRAMMFSNFQPFEFEVNGLKFHSTEQRYQWLRLTQKPEFQAKILTYTGERNGWECKEYVGKRQVKPFVDMDIERRINDMRECLTYKLQYCEGFKDLLLATGNATLVEFAPWGDDFWGAVSGGRGGKGATLKGANVMGKLLMELRDTLNGKVAEKPVTTPAIAPKVEPLPTDQGEDDSAQDDEFELAPQQRVILNYGNIKVDFRSVNPCLLGLYDNGEALEITINN